MKMKGVKNTAKIVMLTCVMVLLFGFTNTRGYNTIEELYKSGIMAIKSKDKKQIAEFVTTMLPDKNTATYMEENDCEYRGFPNRLKEYPNAIESAIDQTTQFYYDLAFRLEERYGNLDSLKFIGFNRELSPESLNDRQCNCQDILFEEPWGLIVDQRYSDTLEFQFGEVLKVNGEWKAFTVNRKRF
ncbi:MAG: hypothetical protein K9I29_02570 [Bacteroidales bacterium]|nr:hypothetical protein [Bacteroidales bacterium]MCF8327151.1 hypothetical protein [Bacteroidales bacterium]